MCQYQAIQCVNPLIRAYRMQAQKIKDDALQHALHQIALGHSAEYVITRLANQLTNKLIHTPSHQLHEAGLAGNQIIIDAAENLLIEKS